MIDYGLLASMIIAFGLPTLISNWWAVSERGEPVGFIDVAVVPAFVGLAVGRLTTLALDDPNSIGSLSDMLIIRSGVEFWPGVGAALIIAIVAARRSETSAARRIAELAPLAMIGYAGYEAACIFRDGCFGPDSPIGLRPPGLSTTMVPVGWFMAIAVAFAAVGVRSLVGRGRAPEVVAGVSILTIASTRALGSFWLPNVGDGLTRPHLTSIGVAVVAAIATAATWGRVVAPDAQPMPAASP